MVQKVLLYKFVALSVLLMFGLSTNCTALGMIENGRCLLNITHEFKASTIVAMTPIIVATTEQTKSAEQAERPSPAAESDKVTDDNSNIGVAIANTAKQYIGVPTLWGGTTSNGFDCSGFTMYVFAKNGIDLPRTADLQYDFGLPISKNQLRPGDLVFFETYGVGASHVGIYIGNGEFLHASSSKGVITVARLDNSYFVERYVGSRRYYNLQSVGLRQNRNAQFRIKNIDIA